MAEKRDDETVTQFTMRKIREEIFEECAKIADQVAVNAERRAAGHVPQSAAQEAAYNKMEGAQQAAEQIRWRAKRVPDDVSRSVTTERSDG